MAKKEEMAQALAAALYTLNAVSAREGMATCDVDGDLCCDLCEEAGCVEWRRRIIIKALHPKTIEDFGYEDITTPESEAL